ncbi:hypothetical protein NE539_01780 [Flavonifractor plautii]|uniref:hypothetical protein n=1 Tax=Flavonifractor plautii TaxID=292800 RepID=UPI00210DD33D|nr:hypothetical protein [Flavonifractor plautii]MCQ4992028.1 hypothetical protein [Flavonifractor plautii]
MEIRENENDFSFWFPKVKYCGIPVPRTYFAKLPSVADEPEYARRLYDAFYMEAPREDIKVIREWLDNRIVPELVKENLTGHVFVKNGRFSNKFDARGNCILYGIANLDRAIANINYEAMCVGADGCDEIVVREFIESNSKVTPCIYNGLPLRSEFRVFYDFEEQKPIFTVNYWDFNYVYPHLYAATDKIIFEHERNRLEKAFSENRDRVQAMVDTAMKRVNGLNGQWSVDILMDESDTLWLIDMAIAQRSAYWELQPGKDNRNGE